MEDTIAKDVLTRMTEAVKVNTDAALANAIGITPQSLSDARRKNKVPPAWAVTIAQKYQVSLDWLLLGRNSILHGEVDSQVRNTVPADEALLLTEAEMVLIPLVAAQLSAGHGSFETGGESERRYGFREDFLRSKGHASAMVLMRVDGDSMEPDIKSGDMVLIDQSQKTLRPGLMYAVGVEDMVYLKVVNAMPGKVILHSLNSAYPPLEIDTRGDLNDSVRIVGRCVWSCREL